MILRTIALLLATVAGEAGCTQANPTATPCRDIPANGCPPLSNGSSPCSDTTCAAAYSCTDGTYTFEYACPGFDAGHPADAASDVAVDASSACYDASGINLPPGASASGTIACGDLEPPDCPLSDVLVCSTGSTNPCVGCESLFYCLNGSWFPWGVCTDDGGVVQTN